MAKTEASLYWKIGADIAVSWIWTGILLANSSATDVWVWFFMLLAAARVGFMTGYGIASYHDDERREVDGEN